MEEGAQKQEIQNKNVERRLLGKNLLLVQRIQRLQWNQEESTEEEEMKQQQRMKIMKDLTEKITSKGRMDADRFLSCQPQTVTKRGLTQDGKTLCRNGAIGWRR